MQSARNDANLRAFGPPVPLASAQGARNDAKPEGLWAARAARERAGRAQRA